VVEAARELQEQGTYGYAARARTGSTALRPALAAN